MMLTGRFAAAETALEHVFAAASDAGPAENCSRSFLFCGGEGQEKYANRTKTP
jgi:hypothetical protein